MFLGMGRYHQDLKIAAPYCTCSYSFVNASIYISFHVDAYEYFLRCTCISLIISIQICTSLYVYVYYYT